MNQELVWTGNTSVLATYDKQTLFAHRACFKDFVLYLGNPETTTTIPLKLKYIKKHIILKLS